MNIFLDFAWKIAIAAEMITKTTINSRIISIFFFSSIFFFDNGSIKSRVMVEPLVKTSDERVDIEAERTSTITIPITIGERVESIAGITASKPSACTSIS